MRERAAFRGSSFRKEITLKGTRYEKQIDLELYRQMVDLIYRLSGKEDKMHTMRQIENDSLLWEHPEKAMEEVYGLHYPGEVLERLGEKTEMTIPKIRALGLALGQTKAIHEDGMFIDTQYTRFYQKIFRNFEHTDCYLLAAKYLLEEKEKVRLHEVFLKYPWEKAEEILFALSILPDDVLMWEQVKGRLNQCLGKQRVLDVYDDGDLYIWVSMHCTSWLQGYRKKDLDALKYITRLPNEPARSGNAMQKKLLELGYTLAEIYFLNGIYVTESGIGCAQNSITAERIAVEVCKFFLNGETIYPERAYTLCDKLIEIYKEFSIKLEGAEGILQYLKNEIQLKNVRSYQLLFSYKESLYRRYENEVLFYLDLTDTRWDPLYHWLEKEMFDWLITKTICGMGYTDEELRHFLYRYEALTGEEYACIFWAQQRDKVLDGAFSRLAEANILNPVDLMEEYVKQIEDNKEIEEKWKNMFSYLLEYMEGIGSYEAFQMLKHYMEGRKQLETPDCLPVENLFFDSFAIKSWRGNGERFRDLKFLRLFLTPDEHQELFKWLDATVFDSIPEEYIDFWVKILEDPNTLLWMDEEEARELCFHILPMVGSSYEQKRLQKRYMTEEEYEHLEQEERERKKRKELLEEKRICRKLKREFTKLIAEKAAEGPFQPVYDFLKKKRYPMSSRAKEIVAGYLSCICAKDKTVRITREEMIRLLKLELELVEDELLEMDAIRNTMLGYEED